MSERQYFVVFAAAAAAALADTTAADRFPDPSVASDKCASALARGRGRGRAGMHPDGVGL